MSPDVFFAKYSSTTVIGLEEINANVDLIKYYPNPCSSKFNININKEIRNGELIITDVLGQDILHQKVESGINEISTYNYMHGMYFFAITENGSQMICGKFMVE